MTLLLPDLSEFQPDADMCGIKAKNGGAAIIRACYGTSHPDAVFPDLRAAAKNFSFLGLYQYLRQDQDPAAQAEAFTRLIGRLAPHEVPILDIEEGSGDQSARANQWFAVADRAFGLADLPLNKRSWCYSGDYFAENHGLGGIFDGPRHTWVAAYGPSEPGLGHTLWQCTNGQAGVHQTDWPGAGRCDTSLYHGTLAQLAATITRPALRQDILMTETTEPAPPPAHEGPLAHLGSWFQHGETITDDLKPLLQAHSASIFTLAAKVFANPDLKTIAPDMLDLVITAAKIAGATL